MFWEKKRMSVRTLLPCNDEQNVAVAGDQDLVEATLVTEQDITQAQEVDNSEIEARASMRRRNTTVRVSLMLVTGIFLLLGPTISLVLLLSGDDSNDSGSSVISNISLSSTEAPTMSLREVLSGILPNYTIDSMADPESSQYKAFEWLVNNPFIGNYSDWRILQRFALVTFYFSTGGASSWYNNTRWLNYSYHECLWYSREHFEYAPEAENITWVEVQHANPCEEEDPTNQIEYGIYRHLWQTNNHLKGSLPPEGFLLTNLRSLSLLSNQLLEGSISTCIGQLSSLEALGISTTGVTGTIPSEVGQNRNLISLIILTNQGITGPVPSEAGMLSKLRYLLLDSNVSPQCYSPSHLWGASQMIDIPPTLRNSLDRFQVSSDN
jgi:hypothetical protein